MAKSTILNKIKDNISSILMSVFANKDISEFALAACCFKYTTEGDYNIVTLEEVKNG